MTDSRSNQISISNLSYVEDRYHEFLKNPESVPEQWRQFFDGLGAEGDFDRGGAVGPGFAPPSFFDPNNGKVAQRKQIPGETADASLQLHVDKLVRSYRVRGHLHAQLDPLERPRPRIPELDPSFHGISESDLDQIVKSGLECAGLLERS